MWLASLTIPNRETIDIAEIIVKTVTSFLCQNWGAIKGINASDNKTIAKGIDKIEISNTVIRVLGQDIFLIIHLFAT